ncbi:hypothetical protein A2U01_0098671, partial [Trifolium medium]|nr:hypothetical protein [Trifolium medium]
MRLAQLTCARRKYSFEHCAKTKPSKSFHVAPHAAYPALCATSMNENMSRVSKL